MNKVILMGRLTKDPELKTTPNRLQIARFTLAVDGINKTDFINCVAFAKTAELLQKYVKQGQRVVVEGKWHTDSYDTENGKRYVNECIVDRFEFVEKRDEFVDAPADTDFFD